jgi:DNA (cytosine-5)-methyltransferase 1
MMSKVKILNLYAGIGGNRKLWGDEHEITAVENNSDIAKVYSICFPKDKVIVADAHDYLLEHFTEFDFIWSSPPCQSHSSFRQNIGVRYRGVKPIFVDMKLWQEILFLQANSTCKWVVENVNPYYSPLINPTVVLQRHLFWSNYEIKETQFEKDSLRSAQIAQLQKLHGFNLDGYKLPNKRQVLRNCVAPHIGLHVLQQMFEGGQ